MLLDMRSLPDGSTIQADLCIVGAGPAGLTIAKRLAGKGLRIAVLESGGEEPEPEIDALTEGEYQGIDVEPLSYTRVRALGGTSVIWHGQCRSLDAHDFEARSWVPNSGWPFGLGELEPHYAAAQEILRFEPANYDIEYWADATGMPILPLREDGGIFHRVTLIRPMNFWIGYASDLASADDVAVHLHGSILGVHAAPDGQDIERLSAGTLDGKRFVVRARTYVLACGGLENARLLLLSNDVYDTGLGNHNDQVGRCFMEHPRFAAGTLLLPGGGMPAKGIYAEAYVGDGFSVRGDLGIPAEVQEREQIGNVLGRLRPSLKREATEGEVAARYIWRELRQGRFPGDLADNLWTAMMDVGDVTSRVYDEIFNEAGDLINSFEFEIYVEQRPNADSRVTLDDARDAFGQPLIRLRWDLTDFDRRTALRGIELFAQAIGASEIGRVRVEVEAHDVFPPDTGWGHHHMGTTRMSDDPKRGVTDRHGRVHGLSNLYVAGSSIFPTSGCATPTLTVLALAVRLSDHLEHSLRDYDT